MLPRTLCPLAAAGARRPQAIAGGLIRCHMTTRATQFDNLADRRSFGLDAEKWAAFMATLEAPVRDLPRLKRLLNEPSIFPDPIQYVSN
ncbi:DUF1778 domain-containing protein [Mesorhizobium sp. M2A.F.Ca.ET.037.01.1.1]|nr:DUF1778 domain-containing protein [Mesorhizobium sp. M2A.F.Ca.ET.043.02.1.1]AZO37779.1 DUF1778 domain-containing protein [Mesorhizobium sp. M2A.F.Ca.ET.046.03.2.1]RUW35997.1 DUF1778 domain-containing protein [Mesorhizobium sp. M2A.F.Ca.ET.015.02.1.1]RUW74330.1 DUF1778 domain-containing protein [Mesorhizobium sp. M2A.F.Ca.ET.067.02.1.1]RUX14054.1 DUF1778 domain-containing protein [Mesorhizobium sp. M2A.F.Ca.ET.037.01.1.1]RUY02352.1 DUF1778 domain-containing protein [Mesorhizobium sp. M2A.F.C